jgi:isopentenyl-diphosphate delta-isomerase
MNPYKYFQIMKIISLFAIPVIGMGTYEIVRQLGEKRGKKNENKKFQKTKMESEKLVIVDRKDNVIGTANWEEAHEKGLLHRGVLVFVFNKKNQLLITQRSEFKKLWPLYWDGSCATHVYVGEGYLEAAKRRLPQELGISGESIELTFLSKFIYKQRYKDVGTEHEICALLLGKYTGKEKIIPNPKEVKNYEWKMLDELIVDINRNPNKYTPWLKKGLELYEHTKLKRTS